MFKISKLLKFLLSPFMMHVGEETGGGGGAADAGGFDMAGAMDSIADGLGFGSEESTDDKVDDNPAGSGDDADKSGGTPGDGEAGTPGDQKPATAPAQPAPGSAPPPEAGTGTPPAAGVAPRTWRPEAAAEWEKLSPVVQAEIAKREEDMFKGLEGYKVSAGHGKAFVEAIGDFLPQLKAVGADPFALTREFMQAHITFATPGNESAKATLLKQIIDGYNLDVSALGLAPADPDTAPYVDPQVKALRDELHSVKSQISQSDARARQQEQAQAEQIRSKFAAEVDAFEANPANIYFKDVAHLIPNLISSGLAKDLQSAYDQAIMLNPVTQAKELARRTTEASTKAAAEAKAKAEAATRAAAANVRVKPKNASGTAPLGSIDDTLNEAYAKLSGG